VSVRRLLYAVAIAAITLVPLLQIHPLPTARALAIWILLLTTIALYVIVRDRRDGTSRQASRFEGALRRPKRPRTEPAQLLRMDRELGLGVSSAWHAENRLLPRLRAVAAARLVSRHGIELDRRPDAARALLGDDIWELLRPNRPVPEDQNGPGVAHDRVVAVIERLETL
jgi:hypothetical protein